MEDRELLDLAAEAAGFKGQWNNYWWSMCDGQNHWDPLRHSGQALILAARLNLIVDMHDPVIRVVSDNATVFQDSDLDACAATRRAIVTAAARLAT